MYQHPLRPQPTWPTAQFAQGPKPPSLSTWPSAPVISTIQNAPASAIHHPVPHQSFVPPAPPGVNPQQWQNGRWMYTGPAAGAASAQPHGPYPPPSLVGWTIPAGWGITPQYYFPAQVQKQPDRSYWDTKLTDNGLGLENMHIKKPVTHSGSGEGKDKAPHTPWAWVPRELDDDDDESPQASSAPQYPNGPHSQQPNPSLTQPGGRQNGATGSAAVGGTGYPGPGPHPAHSLPSHAYFSLPPDQQQQQQQQHQQQSAADAGAGSRPALPPPAVYSAHVRQQSNPHQTTSATHHQPSTAPGSQPTTGLPSQPTPSAQALLKSQGVAAPTPQRPSQRESFTSVRQLRPTFSPAIVRTPSHYRHDSSQPVVPSPLVTHWDEGSSSGNNAGVSTSANKHLSGAQHAVVPSPRVLPWNAHPRVNDGGSPTPAPRSSRMSRTESAGRIYESSARPLQPLQRSLSIPEPPRLAAHVSRQHSMPVVPSNPDSHGHSSSIANLPQFAEEPGSDSVMSLSPLLGAMSSDSSESSASATVIAESPPPLFIPPRHSRTPSPCPPRHRRSHPTSRSSSSSPSSSESSSDSEDSDTGRRHRHRRYHSPSDGRSHRHRTYSGHSGGHHHHHHHHPNGHHHHSDHYPSGTYPAPGAYTPQGRSPASSTRTHSSSSSNPLPTPPQERRDPGFSLPPPQQPKPLRGTYRRTLRYGFWNRRGDYLTMDKYVVYAPRGRTNPPDLEGYPAATEGYRDHLGHFVKYDPTLRELPESLPRQGQPPVLPYDKFITYVYL